MRRFLLFAASIYLLANCTSNGLHSNTENNNVADTTTQTTPTDSIRGLNKLWSINQYVGYRLLQAGDSSDIPDKYILSQPDSTGYDWGDKILFNPDGTFQSYYTAPCGVDCFPSSFGRYVCIDSAHIQLYVDSISIHGMTCNAVDKRVNADLGVFDVVYSNDSLIFTTATMQ